jgi:uncharacterized repeat protein (TIGR04052 family)
MGFHTRRGLTLAAAAGLLLTACTWEQPLTLRFEARVGAEPFACGRTYTGLGTTGTTYQPKDLRFYVHAVRLVTAEGLEVPVELTEDGAWQGGGVALLDFEDKTGLCANGTEATRTFLQGTVPAGRYSGLRFTLGVPFEYNHQAKESGAAPLGVSTLYWSWLGGYKFLRLEGNTPGMPTGYNFHLGSTRCQTSAPNVVTACEAPNRVEVELSGFNPERGAPVVLDLAALFSGSNLDTNQLGSNPGCMSAPDDADCVPLFQRLGLPFAGEPAAPGGQVIFREG